MSSWKIHEHLTPKCGDSVLPHNVTARVAVEEASSSACELLQDAVLWPRWDGLEEARRWASFNQATRAEALECLFEPFDIETVCVRDS